MIQDPFVQRDNELAKNSKQTLDDYRLHDPFVDYAYRLKVWSGMTDRTFHVWFAAICVVRIQELQKQLREARRFEMPKPLNVKDGKAVKAPEGDAPCAPSTSA